MNADGREGNVNANRIESRLRCTLAMLAALTTMWVCAVPSPAQSVATAVPAVKLPSQAARTTVQSQTPAKGFNAGIQVHGHWVIDVKNPDGKLVSHTEFENSLQNGGQFSLALLLSGYAQGDWEILLDGPTGQEPCLNSLNTSGIGPCGVVESGGYFLNSSCINSGEQCFPTLQVMRAISPTGVNQGAVTLTGIATVGAAGVISNVQTNSSLCTSSTTPAVCQTGTGIWTQGPFTAATLPVSNTPSTPCGGTGQPSCAVPVTAGQVVNVSVTISFQ